MDNMVGSAVRTRKPRGQGASRRGEILLAAKRLFAEEGFDRVTMRRIATVVGVSATALYVYFPDKNAILRAIAVESFTALNVAHQRALRPDWSPAENLRAGLRAYVQFALDHPVEYRLIFLRFGQEEEFNPCKDVPEADAGFGLLVANVQAAIQAGVFPPGPPVLLSEAIWASLHGLVALLLMHREALESDPVALTEQVFEMTLRGLAARS